MRMIEDTSDSESCPVTDFCRSISVVEPSSSSSTVLVIRYSCHSFRCFARVSLSQVRNILGSEVCVLLRHSIGQGGKRSLRRSDINSQFFNPAFSVVLVLS
jgi:hypothetical protein